jgi:hypothetical protein
MNIYKASIWWRYSSVEYGLIKANSIEEAEEKLKSIFPSSIGVEVAELEFGEDYDDYCRIYSS